METMEPTVESGQPPVQGEAGSAESAGAFRMCILTFEKESLAIDLSQVREVFKIDSITPVPGMPPALVGVANIRGSIVPVVDLHPSLGLPSVTVPRYAVVVGHGARGVGILVNDVPEIQTVAFEDLQEMSSGEEAGTCPLFSGALKTAGRTIGMMDVSRLLVMIEGKVDRQAA
jgi:purine-binding chemotaxis protein CheW